MTDDIMILENPHEILWEFTLKCNKNCSYCGSKAILNNIKPDDIKYSNEYIANQIIKVHPNEVTITGGEPSCEYEELVKCVKILYDAGIKVKILTNGNLFQKMLSNYEICDELNRMITCYGLSINEVTDLNSTVTIHSIKDCSIKDKITIITNFGTHNINDIDKIAKFAMQYNCWQVQLTIGNEYQLDLDQIEELEEKLKKIESSGLLNIVRADNLTCGKCKAGIYGFSITYDGLIVPCLSYRSWKSNMMVQGTVDEIEEIWKNGFKFNRTRKFVPSCKTISGIEKLYLSDEQVEFIKKQTPPQVINDPGKLYKQIRPDVVSVYGVVNPNYNYWNTPLVYGVTEPINTFKDNAFKILMNTENENEKD